MMLTFNDKIVLLEENQSINPSIKTKNSIQ